MKASSGECPLNRFWLNFLLVAILLPLNIEAAPVHEDNNAGTSLETGLATTTTSTTTGCYYNFEHYYEGDRIVTNEPCLNCTCHNRMLMCYLRVCPFTKAIGQDCTVEKRPDQCCPVITCPQVPVALLTSSTTEPPSSSTTSLSRLDNYGCTLNHNTFYPDGTQVPSDPRKPCELCYCIRNHTACIMQECTLNVEGCKPVYQAGVCCPVRYDCEYEDTNDVNSSTTASPTTVGLQLQMVTTTAAGSPDCIYEDKLYHDGEMVTLNSSSQPCEHCYCMRGDIVCAVQECGSPLEGTDCTAVDPPPGQCCPTSYQCANGTVPIGEHADSQTDHIENVATTNSEDVEGEKPPRIGAVEDVDKEEEEEASAPATTQHSIIEKDQEQDSNDLHPQQHLTTSNIVTQQDTTEINSMDSAEVSSPPPLPQNIENVEEEGGNLHLVSATTDKQYDNKINQDEYESLTSTTTTTERSSSPDNEDILNNSEQQTSSTEQSVANEIPEITTTASASPVAAKLDTLAEATRVPGEGSCLVDGITYPPNAEVPHSLQSCHESCRCVNSIVNCKRIECALPPANYINCMPVQTADSCCPTYMCDQSPSDAPEIQNQLSIDKIDTDIVEDLQPESTIAPSENLTPGVLGESSGEESDHLKPPNNEKSPPVNVDVSEQVVAVHEGQQQPAAGYDHDFNNHPVDKNLINLSENVEESGGQHSVGEDEAAADSLDTPTTAQNNPESSQQQQSNLVVQDSEENLEASPNKDHDQVPASSDHEYEMTTILGNPPPTASNYPSDELNEIVVTTEVSKLAAGGSVQHIAAEQTTYKYDHHDESAVEEDSNNKHEQFSSESNIYETSVHEEHSSTEADGNTQQTTAEHTIAAEENQYTTQRPQSETEQEVATPHVIKHEEETLHTDEPPVQNYGESELAAVSPLPDHYSPPVPPVTEQDSWNAATGDSTTTSSKKEDHSVDLAEKLGASITDSPPLDQTTSNNEQNEFLENEPPNDTKQQQPQEAVELEEEFTTDHHKDLHQDDWEQTTTSSDHFNYESHPSVVENAETPKESEDEQQSATLDSVEQETTAELESFSTTVRPAAHTQPSQIKLSSPGLEFHEQQTEMATSQEEVPEKVHLDDEREDDVKETTTANVQDDHHSFSHPNLDLENVNTFETTVAAAEAALPENDSKEVIGEDSQESSTGVQGTDDSGGQSSTEIHSNSDESIDGDDSHERLDMEQSTVSDKDSQQWAVMPTTPQPEDPAPHEHFVNNSDEKLANEVGVSLSEGFTEAQPQPEYQEHQTEHQSEDQTEHPHEDQTEHQSEHQVHQFEDQTEQQSEDQTENQPEDQTEHQTEHQEHQTEHQEHLPEDHTEDQEHQTEHQVHQFEDQTEQQEHQTEHQEELQQEHQPDSHPLFHVEDDQPTTVAASPPPSSNEDTYIYHVEENSSAPAPSADNQLTEQSTVLQEFHDKQPLTTTTGSVVFLENDNEGFTPTINEQHSSSGPITDDHQEGSGFDETSSWPPKNQIVAHETTTVHESIESNQQQAETTDHPAVFSHVEDSSSPSAVMTTFSPSVYEEESNHLVTDEVVPPSQGNDEDAGLDDAKVTTEQASIDVEQEKSEEGSTTFASNNVYQTPGAADEDTAAVHTPEETTAGHVEGDDVSGISEPNHPAHGEVNAETDEHTTSELPPSSQVPEHLTSDSPTPSEHHDDDAVHASSEQPNSETAEHSLIGTSGPPPSESTVEHSTEEYTAADESTTSSKETTVAPIKVDHHQSLEENSIPSQNNVPSNQNTEVVGISHQTESNEPAGFPSWTQKPFHQHTTEHIPQQPLPPSPDEAHYPSGFEQDYEDDDGTSYGPGTCRYGGKVYLSAQQIPRDDPCDFCFCFRSDIICLQQSCPPPIKGCYQEAIKGFCCPRYECHVSMANVLNITTTTTTTTTTLPPHFFAHAAYKNAAEKAGCQVKGVAYNVGDSIPSTSGPCLQCRCGANGQMKCEPTVCGPQEALLRQVMDAASVTKR